MYNYSKKLTAQLLLFSFLLESCYNPNIGIGEKVLLTPADPAYKQRQYEEEPYDKYREQPVSHIFTTADNHPVRFTYLNGQWQAEVEEYAANGFSQRRQLPVIFERGLTLQDLVDSNLHEQKQLLHICPYEDNINQPGYVCIGRAPIQAKPHPQLLSSPAVRQAVLPSEVGLAQQQVATQPKQVGTSPQQGQEEAGLQVVTSPWQETAKGSDSREFQRTSTPSPVRQQLAQQQSISPQQTASKQALSLRNQNQLLGSQRAAQARRLESAVVEKPVSELAQLAQPRQAIVPTPSTPTQTPSLADEAPQGIESQVFLAQGGHQVRFIRKDAQWEASVMERLGMFSRAMTLPVACEGHGDVAKALADLQEKPTKYTQRRIHVMHTKQLPYVPRFVYLGEQGLKGGGDRPEASGSRVPQGGLPTGDTGASGGEDQVPAAPQGPEAALAEEISKQLGEGKRPELSIIENMIEGKLPGWEKPIAYTIEDKSGDPTSDELTLLHIMARYKYPCEAIEPLIKKWKEQGGDIEKKDPWGRVALHLAAKNANTQVVKWLLSLGVKDTITDSDEKLAIHYACEKCYKESMYGVIESLLASFAHGLQVSIESSGAGSQVSVGSDFSPNLEKMVGEKAKKDLQNYTNRPDKKGNTPLYYTSKAMLRALKILKKSDTTAEQQECGYKQAEKCYLYLKQHLADPNHRKIKDNRLRVLDLDKDLKLVSPQVIKPEAYVKQWMVAVELKDLAMIKKLENVIKVHTPINEGGPTILYWLIDNAYKEAEEKESNAYQEAARILVEKAEEKELKDLLDNQSSAYHPLYAAVKKGAFQIVKMLIYSSAIEKYKDDAHSEDKVEGEAVSTRGAIVKDFVDEAGQNLLHVACEHGYIDVVKLLLEFRAIIAEYHEKEFQESNKRSMPPDEIMGELAYIPRSMHIGDEEIHELIDTVRTTIEKQRKTLDEDAKSVISKGGGGSVGVSTPAGGANVAAHANVGFNNQSWETKRESTVCKARKSWRDKDNRQWKTMPQSNVPRSSPAISSEAKSLIKIIRDEPGKKRKKRVKAFIEKEDAQTVKDLLTQKASDSKSVLEEAAVYTDDLDKCKKMVMILLSHSDDAGKKLAKEIANINTQDALEEKIKDILRCN